ncbi:MAG: RusA family crossover junction endodeoxyribonuclease [Leuconostoc falkenbergense]|uniref:RusA family crossover junction endodeoxyribonuclease n=1 Tax=Leuconostoc falkenbergense TaxID=2766470 RepID=UPI0039E7678A
MTKFIFESELVFNPAPHNQSNFNKFGQVYKGKREFAYITELQKRLKVQIMRDKSFKKYGEVPIKVDYIFGFAPTKSWSKKKIQRALSHEIYPTEQNKGDWDNLTKSTQDRLNKLIIADDRFIVDGRARKIFTPKPYLRIEIEEV